MNKKTDSQRGEFLYGIHPILELLKAKRRKIITIYTTKPTPKAWAKIEKLLPDRTNIQYVTRQVLDKLANSTDHQLVVALATPFIFRKKFFEPSKQPFLLMLDGVQDVKNLGAILRSAYCTGVDGIILTQTASAPMTAAAIKASAGLAEYLEIYVASSAGQAAFELKRAGYKSYLALLTGARAQTVDFVQPLCLIIGNEATGISPDILNSGVSVTLGQKRPDISYNASVAAGILLYYIAVQNSKI